MAKAKRGAVVLKLGSAVRIRVMSALAIRKIKADSERWVDDGYSNEVCA
jgi:hypothetical protein